MILNHLFGLLFVLISKELIYSYTLTFYSYLIKLNYGFNITS